MKTGALPLVLLGAGGHGRVLAALAPLIYTAFTSAGLLPFPPMVIPAMLFKTSGSVLP